MFDLGDQLAGLDLTGAALLPGWMLALVTAAAVLVCTIRAMRYGFEISNASVVSFAVVFIAALAVAWLLDHWAARDLAAERRAVDARAFELRLRAVTPGSALACLDATAGEMIQDALGSDRFRIIDRNAPNGPTSHDDTAMRFLGVSA